MEACNDASVCRQSLADIQARLELYEEDLMRQAAGTSESARRADMTDLAAEADLIERLLEDLMAAPGEAPPAPAPHVPRVQPAPDMDRLFREEDAAAAELAEFERNNLPAVRRPSRAKRK